MTSAARRARRCGCLASCSSRARSISICRRSEEHTSELQSRGHLVCRLLLEKKKQIRNHSPSLLANTGPQQPNRKVAERGDGRATVDRQGAAQLHGAEKLHRPTHSAESQQRQ